MRPVTLTDLGAAARVLLALPPERREAAMAALLARTDLADRHRQRSGRLHPAYGNGTLMAAALAHPRRDPVAPGDAEWLDCLHCALRAVIAHRSAGRAT